MRNFKRFLTLTLAVLMVVSMFAFNASAAQFTDVDAENEYLNKAVNLLNHVGVVKGTSETTFGTDELVTREQMAAFIYRLMKKGNSVEGGDNSSTFTDLEDPTFFFMVSWANAQGIIKGTSATTFEPKGSITLQDAYTMIIRALGYEDEGTLSYPFEFIGIAEQKGVELDEGLDSSVSYTDALTRGDVAILLYNAFFAETGIPETKQVEKLIGTGDKATWVLQTVTEYPTLCEKIFDVLEVEYQAVATPNYTFGESETTKSLGYDAVLFNYVGEERTDAPAQFYAAAEDLALDGDLDDYIMSHFTMYVTLDDDDAVEEILYAEPLINSKTVNEIKLETLSSNTAYSYYGDSADNAKRLSGKVLIDGKEAYFYNAPYSYATPTYPTGSDDVDKYVLRNEKNLKFISMALLGDADDAEYTYTLDNVDFVDVDDEYFKTDSVTLIDELAQVYTGGLYEATVYDVDGDGLYDYINYMPYSFAIVDTDDDYLPQEGEVVISCLKLNCHPKRGVMVYKIAYQDKSIVYATDKEGYVGGDRKLSMFARNTDLLIHDAQYTTDEYLSACISKQGYGHSTFDMALEAYSQSHAKSLAFFHLDPNYTDEMLIEIENHYTKTCNNVFIPKEGQEITIL